MSLTTSFVLLSRVLGLPCDVVNIVLSYSASELQPWVPVFDHNGKVVYRKVNPEAFSRLLNTVGHHLFSRWFLDSVHTVVYNGLVWNSDCCSRVLSCSQSDNGTHIFHVYIEIRSGTLVDSPADYLSMYYAYSHINEVQTRRLISGTLYRPSQLDEWGREQHITSFRYENDVMYLEFLDIHAEWVFDAALGVMNFEVDVVNI